MYNKKINVMMLVRRKIFKFVYTCNTFYVIVEPYNPIANEYAYLRRQKYVLIMITIFDQYLMTLFKPLKYKYTPSSPFFSK
jgi:hypothetical protein